MFIKIRGNFMSNSSDSGNFHSQGHYTETATIGVLRKKVFLKISQKLQKNIYTRVPFLIKLKTLQLY